MIQDRDPLTVPSTRRNPVLADVFNRLGYMERKGSGFGKIISGYEFQINYNDMRVKRYFAPHLIHELLRCYATSAILHTFGIR
ncbi:MAG: hypothetical protein MR508_01930 [Lachnospiraceae bacterium]|nr:hypothetical protein [Lachnospiraceae bacterium]